jgi:hypothetical protein
MADRKDIPPAPRLCRNSVHGSTRSPRTDGDTPKFKDSAVRSEALEGPATNCDTAFPGGRTAVSHHGEDRS